MAKEKLKDKVPPKAEEPKGIADLSIEDFEQIPEATTQAVHPFEGYPMQDIDMGKFVTKNTFIVALDPGTYIEQDKSGERHAITVQKGPHRGQTKMVDLETFHSRIVPDSHGQNTDYVFDRVLETKSGNLRYTVVADHFARARILFYYDSKANKIRVDKRYRLLDMKQKSRLRDVFQIIINPKIKNDLIAESITKGE